MDDYFAAESPIRDRVRATVPGLKEVLPAVDTFAILERGQIAPAAFVLYSGDQVGDDNEDGAAQVVLQRWTVVLATRNVADPHGGAGHRDQVGPWMADIAQALIGWRPAEGFGQLRKTSTAVQPYYKDGYAYFPQTFALPFMLINTD